jgi:hypothetical protein
MPLLDVRRTCAVNVHRIRLFNQLRLTAGTRLGQREKRTSGRTVIAYVLGPDFMRSTICDLMPFSFS